MGKRHKQTFLQRRHTASQLVPEKMLNIASYQRNANQNYNEVSPHAGQMAIIKKSVNDKCWRRYKKTEPSYAVGGDVNWYSHYREQYGGSLKN